MITDMLSMYVSSVVTGISNYVVASSEVHFGDELCLLFSCFGIINIILFQSPIGFHIPYQQVMYQVFNCTHTCRAKFVSTGLCILQSSNVLFNADLSIPF